MIFDLHSHTSFSDGALQPQELLSRAADRGVDVLSITDHDTLDAYGDVAVPEGGLKLIAGIEFSTQWQTTGIHVLGLNIDPQNEVIRTAAKIQSDARLQRARRIGEKLRGKGIKDAFEGARKLAPGTYIGRPHFAQYLIDIGKANTMGTAFKKYMGDGKAGDVRQHWADLPQIIQWILAAGGIPVLAHPMKYKLTGTKLKKLLDDFKQSGGQGMEVVSGQQLPQQTREMARLCERGGLLASCGSDFHMPGKSWAELGAFPPLPGHLKPVWDLF